MQRLPLTGRELRGCWEPSPETAHVDLLSKVIDDAQRVRAARAPVPAYQAEDAPPHREFVPVEELTATGPSPAPDALARAGEGARPPFVVEPEPAWAERTSLFGDLEG